MHRTRGWLLYVSVQFPEERDQVNSGCLDSLYPQSTGKKHGGGYGGGYHRSTDDGAVVQSRFQEIPLDSKTSNNGTETATSSDTKSSGSYYSYSSYY